MAFKLPTVLEFLRIKTASEDVERPDHPSQAAALAMFSSVTPDELSTVIENFTHPEILRSINQSVFYSHLTDQQIRDQLALSTSWSEMKPGDLLCYEAPKKGYGSKIITDAEISKHTKSLLSRKDAFDDKDFKFGGFFKDLLKISGINLSKHITELSILRDKCPDAFCLILEDNLAHALLEIHFSDLAYKTKSHLFQITYAHWLLHRAFYLQLSAAFIVSLSNTQTPRLLRPYLRQGDVSATAAMQWVSTFGASSHSSLKGHARHVATGADAGSPGVKPLPQRWLDSVLTDYCDGVDGVQALRYALAVSTVAESMIPAIPYIVGLPPARIAETLSRVRDLHSAAGVEETDDCRRLTMFTIWTCGISQTTMLLGFSARYLKAVQAAKRYIANPDLIYRPAPEQKHPNIKSRDVVAVADDIAAHLMGDWAPKLMNTDKSLKLARGFADSLDIIDPTLPLGIGSMRAILDPLRNTRGHLFAL